MLAVRVKFDNGVLGTVAAEMRDFTCGYAVRGRHWLIELLLSGKFRQVEGLFLLCWCEVVPDIKSLYSRGILNCKKRLLGLKRVELCRAHSRLQLFSFQDLTGECGVDFKQLDTPSRMSGLGVWNPLMTTLYFFISFSWALSLFRMCGIGFGPTGLSMAACRSFSISCSLASVAVLTGRQSPINGVSGQCPTREDLPQHQDHSGKPLRRRGEIYDWWDPLVKVAGYGFRMFLISSNSFKGFVNKMDFDWRGVICGMCKGLGLW